jgi:hypothetical protein
MRLYANTINYDETIKLTSQLDGVFNEEVIFHCFWNGKLNEKHYISILSCYYFNIKNKNDRKIILWGDLDFEKNEWYYKILQICDIKIFNFRYEIENTFFQKKQIVSKNNQYSYISDIIRYVLLYKYGGVWFDLDIFFLKNIDKLLYNFKDDVCVYNWAEQNYPNGAYLQNINKLNPKFEKFISYLIDRNRGFGFQESQLNFDSPVDLLVLPCSWFDGPFCIDFPEPFDRISNGGPDLKSFFKYTEKEVKLDNFAVGAFCYHWHNLWYDTYEENSFFDRLKNDLISKINK